MITLRGSLKSLALVVWHPLLYLLAVLSYSPHRKINDPEAGLGMLAHIHDFDYNDHSSSLTFQSNNHLLKIWLMGSERFWLEVTILLNKK